MASVSLVEFRLGSCGTIGCGQCGNCPSTRSVSQRLFQHQKSWLVDRQSKVASPRTDLALPLHHICVAQKNAPLFATERNRAALGARPDPAGRSTARRQTSGVLETCLYNANALPQRYGPSGGRLGYVLLQDPSSALVSIYQQVVPRNSFSKKIIEHPA